MDRDREDSRLSGVTRRSFLSAAAVAGLAGSSKPGPGGPGATSKGPGTERCTPAGELARRVRMNADRLAAGTMPTYTDEFILADVRLAPARRFNNFSGDLSGRWIEAFSVMPAADGGRRAGQLAVQAIKYQRADGRFGNPELVFTADAIGPEHMALLWGNGRLLVGLLAAYSRTQEPAPLESAKRLGAFLLKVRKDCSDPAVIKRLEGLGANGAICFTQLVEGLVELAKATSDRNYLEVAAAILPLLGPRGIQHSHGYLSTLRGVVMLYHETRDKQHLEFAEKAFRDLVRSSDYTIFGSVTEYFGWNASTTSAEELSTIIGNSGHDPRDEGCSHADFVRLSLKLWEATRNPEYLELAERCLWNGLYPNQHPTGDFGSHAYFPQGIKPVPNLNRSWWCCTMHGYRAFHDILETAVTRQGEAVVVNLLEEVDWTDGACSLHTRWGAVTQQGLSSSVTFSMEWRQATGLSPALAVRKPSWADRADVMLNGRPLEVEVRDGFWQVSRAWKKGDRIDLRFVLAPKLTRRDGKVVDSEAVGNEAVEAAMTVGPWLMGVSSAHNPLFFGEPWPGNTIELAEARDANSKPAPQVFPALRLAFVHGGFPGKNPVTLQPLCQDYRGSENAIRAVWLRFRRA
jgi:DUF1680 family protein